MSRPRAHGLTKSVQDRLGKLAKDRGRPYAELLQLFALERFLYRLSQTFQAMVQLGVNNTRMKDYFDIATLANQLSFDGGIIAMALQKTFEARNMELPLETPPGLQDSFAEIPVKKSQWKAFVRKGLLQECALSFEATVKSARRFLMPAVNAAARREGFAMNWPPGGPWQP